MMTSDEIDERFCDQSWFRTNVTREIAEAIARTARGRVFASSSSLPRTVVAWVCDTDASAAVQSTVTGLPVVRRVLIRCTEPAVDLWKADGVVGPARSSLPAALQSLGYPLLSIAIDDAWTAVKENDCDALRRALDRQSVNVPLWPYTLDSALVTASRDNKKVALVTMLVEELGADVHQAALLLGSSPLALAAQNGAMDVVDVLLRNGALHTASRSVHFGGYTPLHFAAHRNDVRMAQRLLESGGASFTLAAKTNENAFTPFLLAAHVESAAMVDFLLSRNPQAIADRGRWHRNVFEVTDNAEILCAIARKADLFCRIGGRFPVDIAKNAEAHAVLVERHHQFERRVVAEIAIGLAGKELPVLLVTTICALLPKHWKFQPGEAVAWEIAKKVKDCATETKARTSK